MTRITLTGEDLAGFAASGPADHVRMIIPDPDTGELTLPTLGQRGGLRLGRGGAMTVRDYTPLAYRPESLEVDIDFLLHGDGGPAASWAARASVGDPIGMAGPGRSVPAPQGVTNAVLVADETALPAAKRWLEALQEVPVTALLSVADPTLESYFADLGLPETENRQYMWFTGPGREEAREKALRALAFDAGSFVYMAGEATTLIPLRRYLRRDLGLAKEQVQAEGFWKKGVAMLDHHEPVDPSDPD